MASGEENSFSNTISPTRFFTTPLWRGIPNLLVNGERKYAMGFNCMGTKLHKKTLTAKSFLRIICRECIIYLKYMVLVNTDYLHSVSCIIHSLFIEMSLKNCQICIPFNLICFFVNTCYGSARRVVHVLPSLVPFQRLGC